MHDLDPRRVTEIESAEGLLRHIEATGGLQNVAVQGIDLTGQDADAALTSVPAEDAFFLGCRLSDAAERHVRETGGTIFPAFRELPFHPYRASLYTPAELIEGYERGHPETRNQTTDARIYEHFKERKRDGREAPIMDALAFRIHDHAIDNALRALLHPSHGSSRQVVGVMGGHQIGRDVDVYRQVAHLGWKLARAGFFVATGGGPGAMEAANLGAALAHHEPDAVDTAIEILATAPHFEDDAFVERALDVRDRFPDRTESLAVPTWFYGHEPSNLFSTHVAKYFANSIREDGLLAIATYGIVYAPGSAGTIQEVFMDAAQNHYETFGPASPMVFLDRTYWMDTKPVYPLMQTLAEEMPYDDLLVATDDIDSAVSFVEEHAAARGE